MMKLFQRLIKVLKKFGINANKIELSANDILNLLAGNEINLGSKKITIESDNFSVDKNGIMKCVNAIMKNAQIEGGNLKMWGKSTLDGVRVFKDDSKNTSYMAYMVSDSIGVNDGENSSGMLPDYIGTGNSSMTPNKISSPVITQTSLAEQKKNFEKMQDRAVDILKNIDIYKYNLKCEKDTDKKHIGFVIGDKYNYSKEVTSLDNKGVDNYSFTSLCCKAIQELSQQVEALQNEIKVLKEEKQ